jgi:TP901 family phage tail tape measure protein
MAGGIFHTIGVLLQGHNGLSAVLVRAEHSLTSFRKTAEATALAINSKLSSPDIDMSAVDKAASSLTGIGTKAMVAGGVMAAGLGVGVFAAMKFNTAMTEVSTLVDGAETDVAALTTSVKTLSSEIGAAPVETAKTLATVIKGGFRDAASATKVLEGSMRLADASFGDMTETANVLTAIMNAYGVEAAGVTTVSDQLFVAAQMGRTTVTELADSMRKVAPLASTAGVGLNELLSATSALSGVMSTTEAVGSLRGVLAALNDPGTEALKTAKALGIDFSATAVKSMGLARWLEDVKEKTGGSEDAMTKLFGPVKVLQGVFALTGSQAESYAGILGKVNNSLGATATAFDKVNATAGDALGDAKANLEGMMVSIGNALLPAVGQLAGLLSGAAAALGAFAEKHPMLTKLVVVLTAVSATVLIIGGAALVMGSQVMAAMAMVNVSTGGVLLAVGALVTGITALVMFFTSGTEEMGASSGILATAWAYLKKAFYAVATPIAYGLGFLVGTLTVAWQTIAAYTAQVWPMLKQVILGAWEGIRLVLSPGIAALTGLFVFAWEGIKVVTNAAWQTIKLLVTTVWNGIYQSVALVWNLISGLFKAGLQLLTGDWSGAWETIKATGEAVLGNIKNLFMGWVTWITGLGGIFMDAGKGLIGAFWQGIQAAWGQLKTDFTTILDNLRSLLPFSDAKEGPLSQLTASGSAFVTTFSAGIKAAADVPVQALSGLLEGVRELLPFSDAKTGPLANLTTSGASVMPTFAAGMEKTAEAPVGAMADALGGLSMSPVTPAASAAPVESGGSGGSVVFQPGAFNITVSGAGALDDLELRLTEIFSRAALRLGGANA